MSRRPDQSRRNAEARGRIAEYWVGFLLLMMGYRRLARRYRTPLGEIDLIARRGTTLVMIEVKYRRALGFRRLHYDEVERTAPSAASQKRLMRAAEFYRARHPHDAELMVRFDLVIVHASGWCWWFRDILRR